MKSIGSFNKPLEPREKSMNLSMITYVRMNGVSTKEDLNIIPLRSYDCLIDMDWLESIMLS
jgi:hypothetical protein